MNPSSKIIVTHNGKRETDGCGYIKNDNRLSGGQLIEDDIFTCFHCQRILVKHKWIRAARHCSGCGKPVCVRCYDKLGLPLDEGGGCRPFIEGIGKRMDSDYHRQQFHKLLGI